MLLRNKKGQFLKGCTVGRRFQKGSIPWNKGTKSLMPPAWNKGKFGYKTKPASEERKNKIRMAHLGRIRGPMSLIHRHKIGLGLKGIKIIWGIKLPKKL